MKIPVITWYSFDSDVVVKLCNSEQEAIEYLKKISTEEYRIDKEENGWYSEFRHEKDWSSATVLNRFHDRDDITTFAIGRLVD